MRFVPSQTPYLQREVEEAEKIGRELGVEPFDLAIPRLGRVSIMIFSEEGCDVCPLALAFAKALKNGSDLVEEVYLVDCGACRDGVLGDTCSRLATLPTIVVGRDVDVRALAMNQKPSGRVAVVMGFSQYGYAVLLDAILSFYILERKELLAPHLERIVSVTRSRGLTLVPNIIERKVFAVKLIKSLVEYGEPRCPCRPAFKCPCIDGLARAQKLGKCYCGYIVRSDNSRSPARGALARSLGAIAMGADLALLIDGDSEVDKSVTYAPTKLLGFLTLPLATVPSMVSEACYRVTEYLDSALARLVKNVGRYVVRKRVEGAGSSEPRQGGSP